MSRDEIASLCTALQRVVENLDALDARTSRERERA